MSKRLWWVDLAKGWTIMLVVTAHSIQGIYKTGAYGSFDLISKSSMFFLFTIIMPVFFALSGFVDRPVDSISSLKSSALKKTVNLIVPYVVFSAIYVALQHFSNGVNSLYTWKDLLLMFERPIGYMWFLYALSFVFLIAGILDVLNFSVPCQVLIGFIFLVIKQYVALPYFLAVSFTWLVCFECGRILKKYNWLYTSKKFFYFFSVLILISLIVQYRQGGMWYDTNTLTLSNSVSKILSIPVAFGVFYYAGRNKINNYFAKYGKYSLVIYMVHAPATSIFRVLLAKMHITNYFLLVILVIALSWMVSVMVIKMCKRSKAVAIVFFPLKVISNVKIS
ncbi:acyltransferase family protein [Lacticaseibacillus paracasei]|uniref:acyltransferase family protein n=1 Tax=Lacticaseibacillus paracasei TaxID=1597 RepID=UPI00336B64CE